MKSIPPIWKPFNANWNENVSKKKGESPSILLSITRFNWKIFAPFPAPNWNSCNLVRLYFIHGAKSLTDKKLSLIANSCRNWPISLLFFLLSSRRKKKSYEIGKSRCHVVLNWNRTIPENRVYSRENCPNISHRTGTSRTCWLWIGCINGLRGRAQFPPPLSPFSVLPWERDKDSGILVPNNSKKARNRVHRGSDNFCQRPAGGPRQSRAPDSAFRALEIQRARQSWKMAELAGIAHP